MSFSQMPPQAYTRDVLASAYEWLRHQPSNIRELATNSDTLVGLYFQSKRRPNGLGSLNANLTTSTDSQSLMQANAIKNSSDMKVHLANESFKNDLKVLAEGLKQFEDPHTSAQIHQNQQHSINRAQSVARSADHSVASAVPPTPSAPASSVGINANTLIQLDSRSFELLRSIKDRFNLSNENEALRMVIVLGFEKIQQTFPSV